VIVVSILKSVFLCLVCSMSNANPFTKSEKEVISKSKLLSELQEAIPDKTIFQLNDVPKLISIMKRAEGKEGVIIAKNYMKRMQGKTLIYR
jgi:hypothetical protein